MAGVMDENEITRRLRDAGTQPVPGEVRSTHLTQMHAAVPVVEKQKRFGRLAVAAAAFAGFAVGSTGFAMAGALPDPAQQVAHDVLSVVQVDVEDPKNRGQCISAAARNPDLDEAGKRAEKDRCKAAITPGPPDGVGKGRPDNPGEGKGQGRGGPPEDLMGGDPCTGPPSWAGKGGKGMTPDEKRAERAGCPADADEDPAAEAAEQEREAAEDAAEREREAAEDAAERDREAAEGADQAPQGQGGPPEQAPADPPTEDLPGPLQPDADARPRPRPRPRPHQAERRRPVRSGGRVHDPHPQRTPGPPLGADLERDPPVGPVVAVATQPPAEVLGEVAHQEPEPPELVELQDVLVLVAAQALAHRDAPAHEDGAAERRGAGPRRGEAVHHPDVVDGGRRAAAHVPSP